MQSCPHETSVLLKCYFNKPSAANYIKEYFEYEEGLLPLGRNSYENIVHQNITRSHRISVIYVCGHHKHTSFTICSTTEFVLLNFLCESRKFCCEQKGKTNLLDISFTINHVLGSQKIKHTASLKVLGISRLQPLECSRINLNTYNNVNYNLCSPFWLHHSFFGNIGHIAERQRHRIIFIIAVALLTYNLYGWYIHSVMEVDETSDAVQEKLKSQKVKEEPLDLCYDCGKCENEYLTVIRNNQNMKETENNHNSNNVECNNYADDKGFKVEHNESSQPIANGNIINCIENNGLDCKSSILKSCVTSDISGSNLTGGYNAVEEKLNHSEIINGGELLDMCKSENGQVAESDPTDKVVKLESNSKDCKSSDCSSERDKSKGKEHRLSNSVSSHSSSKKVDEQSTSHRSSSSSSSSRSKSKDYKSYSHQSSSSSKSCHEKSKSSDQDRSKYDTSDKKKSRNCHHKSEEKCHCKSRHHSRHHSKSKRYQSVKTQCSPNEIAYELLSNKAELSNPFFTRVPWVPHAQLAGLKYGRYYRIETDRNGGATIVHLYMDEINHLNEAQMKECAVEFIKLSYSEDENECAYHVMGIVHGAASYLPDLVDYMADHYPTLTVKTGSLASRDNHTTTMSQYRDEVYKTYSNGTFRYAPLDQLSICGVLGEEVGAYFPDFVARLEQSPFMKPVMPWSTLSVVETDNPRESNDGPIFWVRPGEQMLPANEALKESARPKKRRNNELDNLAYIAGSRSSEARESLFMDRTKAHADQVGVDYGLSNTAPTAAVGVLKSVNCGHPEHGNRATKDVVAFHAQDYNELLEILMLDLYEPPQTQCTKWIEVSKLNTLRREGIRYAHVQLHDNDVYYLPRKIIHQFQTISSVASVAWHIRYKDYFSIMGAPNLHTPTGINKGQVFYEKKNVAVYYPPICENELLASVTNPSSPLPKTPKKYEKLKEYSPFKHTPRKNHKIHSPRSSSKKEKGSDSVPHTPNKKESDSVADCDENKSSSGGGGSAKKDHFKSDGGKENHENSSKKERENSSNRKPHKSDGSSHGQSGDHSSAKKERKGSLDSDSSQRREVKNLDLDFDGERSKGKSSKSPSKSNRDKSGHESRRRSDETRSESGSKHKRHDGGKSKGHEKYDKISHKKSDGTSPASTDGGSEEKSDRGVSTKRKSSDEDSCCSKKIKVETDIAEKSESAGDRDSGSSDDKKMSELGVINADSNANARDPFGAVGESESNSMKENFPCDGATDADGFPVKREPKETDSPPDSSRPEEDKSDRGDDLKGRSADPSAPPSNPPLPCTSPPMNPPLPPGSPASDAPNFPPKSMELNHSEPRPSGPGSSAGVENRAANAELAPGTAKPRDHEQGTPSKEKNNDVLQLKKVKKKIVKKLKEDSESYDLLGDIMSQMDKKK